MPSGPVGIAHLGGWAWRGKMSPFISIKTRRGHYSREESAKFFVPHESHNSRIAWSAVFLLVRGRWSATGQKHWATGEGFYGFINAFLARGSRTGGQFIVDIGILFTYQRRPPAHPIHDWSSVFLVSSNSITRIPLASFSAMCLVLLYFHPLNMAIFNLPPLLSLFCLRGCLYGANILRAKHVKWSFWQYASAPIVAPSGGTSLTRPLRTLCPC